MYAIMPHWNSSFVDVPVGSAHGAYKKPFGSKVNVSLKRNRQNLY